MTVTKRTVFLASLVVCVLVIFVEACGIDVTFRAYLDKMMWRPSRTYPQDLAKGLPTEKKNYVPYAGMTSGGGTPTLQTVRNEYSGLFTDSTYWTLNFSDDSINRLRRLIGIVQISTPAERHEVELLRCKIELRAVKDRNDATLPSVQSCFESYLSQTRPAALASEARGWLARASFLNGDPARAAKLYLDELALTNSNIRRERLINSLSVVFRDLSPERYTAALDQFFDKPSHALFLADQITNPGSDNDAERMAAVAGELMRRLEQHKSLFSQGHDSDALVLALMRAATKMGAPSATLRYAEMLAPNSPKRSDPEYNWLLGTARFLQQDYAGAEGPLKEVVTSTSADGSQRLMAANGLLGVYRKLNRPVDQLWAAFQTEAVQDSVIIGYLERMQDTKLFGWNLDIPYLLDVELSEAELNEYLQRYPDTPSTPIYTHDRRRTPAELVRYALAVKLARREEYSQARGIYEDLEAWPRAHRMKQASELFEKTKTDSRQGQLKALYDYALFLSNNSVGVFFNDSIWRGVQTWSFIPDLSADDDWQKAMDSINHYLSLSDNEVARARPLERRLQDEQEEYWRAYQILNTVVERAGRTPLGRRAAMQAILCLRRISGRFGRGEEIASADTRLSNWLKRR